MSAWFVKAEVNYRPTCDIFGRREFLVHDVPPAIPRELQSNVRQMVTWKMYGHTTGGAMAP